MHITNLSDKYVVMKQVDYANLLMDMHSRKEHLSSLQAQEAVIPGDYFVIREQDVFGPAGLHAYAANIRTFLEVADTTGFLMLDPEDIHCLETLADALHETALSWQQNHEASLRKIPG